MNKLTPEFLHQVEAGAITLILIVLFLWPSKSKPEWDISSQFTYLSACIKCSAGHKELDAYRESVDKFFDRYYRSGSTNAILKRYYARLQQTISEKEIQLSEAKATA